MSTSYQKGEEFEKVMAKKFKDANIEVHRTRELKALRGHSLRKLPVRYPDLAYGGRPAVNVLPVFEKLADICIGACGYTLIVQCKNHNGSIEPNVVRELEGVLTRFDENTTIGILAAPSKEKFTVNTINRAESSKYNIILTDKSYVYLDLIRFVNSRQIRSSYNNPSNFHDVFSNPHNNHPNPRSNHSDPHNPRNYPSNSHNNPFNIRNNNPSNTFKNFYNLRNTPSNLHNNSHKNKVIRTPSYTYRGQV
ncbi:hypothetical protein RCL_jg13343.t1 [Rhizophagus clarus]|uniref:Restriction endonuclease type IV Mrr domain-containing protein n=1 Tax=Rhizophagus clarus TaxID=94130 RepID=A0A8H3LPL2_9GLOM|nr:hypothetical protein RCL_jg13343.t1 [Rhizophagus clarus]